jgi:translation initiation factor 2 alpha subunit (eIF-2alpha)
MSSLRLALKLSMVEAPAGSVQSKSEENEETYNALEKQAQKRKRKMSAGGGDDQQTSSADTGEMAFNLI